MRYYIYTHANIHLIIETNKYIQMFLMIKIKREKSKRLNTFTCTYTFIYLYYQRNKQRGKQSK